MQKLGQHFLKNTAVLEKIVDALALADGDCVTEIGSGHGELTAPLMRAAKKENCTVTGIEKDHALIPALMALAGEMKPGRLSIIEGDVLKLLPEMAATKIVGNIPYYITGKLLRTISELKHKPERVVLLIQKEVAERICATPPDMNRLAASVQFWADAEIVAQVPRKDFSPPPDVDSAVIVLNTKISAEKGVRDLDPALYYRAVRAIFAQPRKTLLNNLSAAAGETIKKDGVRAQIKKIGIDPDARPQDLGVEQIIAIAGLNLWR
jgi:16S rRNA (adenine1518-N6/adenine1519-N6)-dimethyltransferase